LDRKRGFLVDNNVVCISIDDTPLKIGLLFIFLKEDRGNQEKAREGLRADVKD
jgi:hypothetical protein